MERAACMTGHPPTTPARLGHKIFLYSADFGMALDRADLAFPGILIVNLLGAATRAGHPRRP